MESFGAALKREREERGLTLETVAALIKIDRESLEALEHNEFSGLPEHDVMLEGLRAYADCLHVDAELMIEHYEEERERSLQRLAALVEQRVDEIVTCAPPASTEPSRRALSKPLIVSVVAVALAALGAWYLLREEPVAPPGPLPVDAAEPPAAPVTREAPPATGMRISEYGVGTGVRNRELIGRSDQFTKGAQAWFWIRVEQGKPGDTIDHVWLHEGVEAARITLSIGGFRWRTQSSKTLRSAGAWAVEARDAAGRVLARSEFDVR